MTSITICRKRWADEGTLLVGGADHRVEAKTRGRRSIGRISSIGRGPAFLTRRGRLALVQTNIWSLPMAWPTSVAIPPVSGRCFVVTGDSEQRDDARRTGRPVDSGIYIQAKPNEWCSHVYDPGREPLSRHALKTFLLENAKVSPPTAIGSAALPPSRRDGGRVMERSCSVWDSQGRGSHRRAR